jgi:demethylmenaquinone methyltransferase / 2-methoxy-6-polyprenyl-1,4-benzoquinol methylase
MGRFGCFAPKTTHRLIIDKPFVSGALMAENHDNGKAELSGGERGRAVQTMFAQIAPRYDLMNRLMTFGQDVRWRRKVIIKASLAPGQRLLDLGAGTGDLSGEALHQCPEARVVAADFTLQMMLVGKRRSDRLAVSWSSADAHRLPFPDECFEAVVSGFLLRNVTDLPRSLREQHRVLKPGGRIVALDTTPPANNLLKPFIRFQLHTVIPTLGRLIARNPDAYHYLPETTENFVEAGRLAAELEAAGFRQVGYNRQMFGTIAIHWGVK